MPEDASYSFVQRKVRTDLLVSLCVNLLCYDLPTALGSLSQLLSVTESYICNRQWLKNKLSTIVTDQFEDPALTCARITEDSSSFDVSQVSPDKPLCDIPAITFGPGLVTGGQSGELFDMVKWSPG